ncbi:Golgi membrane protein 1 isoform X2 [Corythoichthys intestinalis]|uniref:Golgi membrane protein 1 isoform X2 n=1 Tax=Corythoichthys intestinalis TaxID=161448 RepID=UPI0025A4DC0F|nr:Golgi membrane protein 1 isoform X2 [Corythoichthys intestinalis]
MGGLVNGWRGGRSPPLIICALVACILLLGFNYWVSGSRNLELQAKLYELEVQVRDGALERGAAEVQRYEFQNIIQKQKDETAHIQILHKKQLEAAQNTCSQEKATLEQKVSTGTKTIQELKDQLNEKTKELEKLEKALQACQNNVKTLNDKLTYDMTQCNSQLLSQKELCDERVTATKLEAQKKVDKADNDAIQVDGTAANTSLKASADMSHSSNLTSAKNILKKQGAAVTTVESDIQSDVTKDSMKKHDVAVFAHESKSSLPSNQTQVEVMAANTQAVPATGHVSIDQGMTDVATVEEKLGEVDNFDHEYQQMLEGRGLDLDKQQRLLDTTIDKVMEDELADYNGDDDNEGEFEADKQAALAQI